MKSTRLTNHDKKQIAFYTPQKVDLFTQLEVREQLASSLHRDVDLVELSQANDVIRAQIIGTGQVLEARDQNILHSMQVQWLKQYVMLNRERKPVIDRIQKEGQIYG